MKLSLTTCFVLAVVMTTAALADGPETGVVAGAVTDAQGQALPGVMVILEGQRGAQSTVTDEVGSYRFALLPPGSYLVRTELEGFRETKSAAQVTAGGKAEINLVLAMETAETITVTSEAPMVDKFNVTAGATVSAEVGEEAAGDNRTYYGVINMLPGVTSDAENGDIQGTRPTVNGSHWADNAVFIDGVDTTFGRFGGSRVVLPTTATSEISLVAGGASAEYGRKIGSTTNVIIKSGTNKFHGNFVGTYAATDWYADYKSHPELARREFGPVRPSFFERSDAEWDTDTDGIEATLGGPIKRDKAWFFVGFSDFNSGDYDKTLSEELVDVSYGVDAKIYKLNFQPGASQQIAASYIDSFSERIYFHPPSYDRYTPTPHSQPGKLFSFSWNYSLSSELFFETKLADQQSDENKDLAVPGKVIGARNDIQEVVAIPVQTKQQDPRFPGNPDPTLPNGGRYWPGNNYDVYIQGNDNTWNNGWLLDNGFGTNEFPRQQANAALTWFATSNHEVKFGIDWQEVKWDSNVRTTNLLYSYGQFDANSPSGFVDAGGQIPGSEGSCGILLNNLGEDVCLLQDFNPPDLLALGDGNRAVSTNRDVSLYGRDRFTVGDHLTFNIGLRVEDVHNTNDLDRAVVDAVNVSPRFSMNYDFQGTGRQILSLSAGRYHAQLNQQFTNQWLMEGWNGYSGRDEYIWCDELDVLVHTVLVPGALTDAFGGGCNEVGYNFQIRHVRPGEMWAMADAGIFDVDIEPYFKDEAILGFEWQVGDNWALDAKAIHWEMKNMIGNTLQRDATGSFFELSENYKDYPEILRAINAEAARLGNDPIVAENLIDAFEEGRTEYDALQVQLNRRFAGGWAWYNNVTWSDSSTSGNGAWWNNTNSTYGRDLGTVLTQAFIDGICRPEHQAERTVPITDCQERLQPHLGESISTINRFGKLGVSSGEANEGGALAGRALMLKSFGFKKWEVGKHSFDLGGLFTWQDGIYWGRVEEITSDNLGFDPADDLNGVDPSDIASIAFTGGLDVQVEPVGTRKLDPHWWLNLSAAWEFPLGRNVRGEWRVEVTNVTDEQAQLNVSDKGEVRRVRRDFQRPRQMRTLLSIGF